MAKAEAAAQSKADGGQDKGAKARAAPSRQVKGADARARQSEVKRALEDSLKAAPAPAQEVATAPAAQAAEPAAEPAPKPAVKATVKATVKAAAPATAPGAQPGPAADLFLEYFIDPARGAMSALTGKSTTLSRGDTPWGPPVGAGGVWAWAGMTLRATGAAGGGEAGGGEAALALAMPAADAAALAELIAGGAPQPGAAELSADELETLNDGLRQVGLAGAAEALRELLGGSGGAPAADWGGVRQVASDEMMSWFGGGAGWSAAELAWGAGGASGRMLLAVSAQAVTVLSSASAAEAPAGRGVVVQTARFSAIGGTPAPAARHNIDLIVDIPLQLTVELGRTNRRIKDILALSPGAVIELDKLAGEAVDVLVNGRLVAKGEVVVIDENFGVRITDIVSPAERVSGLG